MHQAHPPHEKHAYQPSASRAACVTVLVRSLTIWATPAPRMIRLPCILERTWKPLSRRASSHVAHLRIGEAVVAADVRGSADGLANLADTIATDRNGLAHARSTRCTTSCKTWAVNFGVLGHRRFEVACQQLQPAAASRLRDAAHPPSFAAARRWRRCRCGDRASASRSCCRITCSPLSFSLMRRFCGARLLVHPHEYSGRLARIRHDWYFRQSSRGRLHVADMPQMRRAYSAE